MLINHNLHSSQVEQNMFFIDLFYKYAYFCRKTLKNKAKRAPAYVSEQVQINKYYHMCTTHML